MSLHHQKSTMAQSVLSGSEDAEDYRDQTLELGSEEDKEEQAEDVDEGDVEEEVPEWKKSKARDYLFMLCLDPSFPSQDSIKPRQVWEDHPWKVKDNRPEFKWFQDYSQFPGWLRAARKRAEQKTGRSREDAEAFKHGRAIYPEQEEDFCSEPVWQGAKAEELLQRDLKDEEKMKLRPKQLQMEKEEYLRFSLENFCNRIYSERKAMQRIVYIKKKRAQKEAKAKRKK
jgi:hypothetical protein